MVRVSAPGKTILMGEHAAVYGRPALVAAVDRRLYVTIEPFAGGAAGEVRIVVPQLGVDGSTTVSALRDEASAAREAWERGDSGSPTDRNDQNERKDRGRLARLALGEAFTALDDVDAQPCIVRVHSELPIGSGFGSSAAAAVALVRAVFEFQDRPIDDATLHRSSLEVERRQHGNPSGIDNATVIHGGVVWVTRERGALHIEPIDVDPETSPVLRRLRLYQTGEPAESTGEVVAAVRALRDSDPERFERSLAEAAAVTSDVRGQLLLGDEAASRRTADAIRRFEACLESWRVVPSPVRRRIRTIEESGGAAKISGAGSLAGPGAGSLVVFHPEPHVLDDLETRDDALGGLERLDVRLGAEGVRVEPVDWLR